MGMWPLWGVPSGFWDAHSVWAQKPGGNMTTLSGGCWCWGGCRLPFTERHPPVVDTDGAVAEASHNEGAVGVAGQAGHAAVSARGDVLGPGTGTVVRPPPVARHTITPGLGPLPSSPLGKAPKAQGAQGTRRGPELSQAHTRLRPHPLSPGLQPAHNSGDGILVPIKLSSVSLFPKKEDKAHFGRDGSS